MIKSILHPTDFSETAHQSLVYAAHLCKAYNATLHIVHAYEKPYASIAYQGGLSAIVDAEANQKIQENIRQKLANYVQIPELQGVKAFYQLFGDVAPWELPKKHPADLVVMGTRGATGIFHGGLLGTVAARTIRYSPTPVLTIPPKTTYKPPEKILFPIDTYEEKNIDSYQKLIQTLPPTTQARVYITVINTPYLFYDTQTIEKVFMQLRQAVPYDNVELRIYNDISVEEGIRHLAEELNVDWIAMYSHGRKGVAHFLYGSITENVAQHLQKPILAIKLED
ncbi:MAG: universal stress protein [Bacteroidia bacterium]